MTVGPRGRSVFWATLALIGLCAGVFLLGVHAEKPKREPQTLVRSAILRVLADGRTLIDMVVEARRIAVKLDEETLAAKSRLPSVKGVFEPIHLGLTKPSKPNEYGGGMSPRLEFIEKNLAKSLQALARLPSSCEGGGAAQWRAAVAGQQLLIKTVIQARQAQAQATWTAKESDKLIQAALPRLQGENDKESVKELGNYNKKLQEGLGSVAKILGKGLAAKSLDKKLMPKLGAKCGSVLALKLPDKKDAGMQLAGAGGMHAGGLGGNTAESVDASLRKSESVRGGATSEKTSSKIRPNVLATLAVASPRSATNPYACALTSCPSDKVNDAIAVIAGCKKPDGSISLECCKRGQAVCNCPDGSPRDTKGECPIKKCSFGYVQTDKGCVKACPDGKTAPDSKGRCPCGKQTYVPGEACCSSEKLLYGFALSGTQCVQACSDGKSLPNSKGNCSCGKQPYNPTQGCCSTADKKYHPGLVSVGGGKCGCRADQVLLKGICKPACGGKAFDLTKMCCFADTTLLLNPDKSCSKMRLSEEQVRQIREKVAQEALKRRDSTEWRRGKIRPPFKPGQDKCNQFVAEVANWWKAKVPNMRGVRNPGPPLARDWANPKFDIPGWIVVSDSMPGDIVANSKHVGIVVGKKLTASAAAPKYGDKINVNDWGFGMDDRPTFRRYIGEAQ